MSRGFINRLVPAVLSLLFIYVPGNLAAAQSGPSREEKIVRMMYAKCDYLTQLDVISSAAMKSYAGTPVDPKALAQELRDAKLTFTLSNFKVGALSEILDDKWANYFTLPLPPQQVLRLQISGQDFTDNNAPTVSWQTGRAQWIAAQPLGKAFVDELLTMTAKQVLEEGNKVHPSGIIYTRYASYTVNETFQGKTNTYKAIYLFGKGPKGEEQASPEDAFASMNGQGTVPMNFYPAGLLHSHLREVPLLAEWFDQNKMTDAECSKMVKGDLCCTDSRCGISTADLQHVLLTPIVSGPAK